MGGPRIQVVEVDGFFRAGRKGSIVYAVVVIVVLGGGLAFRMSRRGGWVNVAGVGAAVVICGVAFGYAAWTFRRSVSELSPFPARQGVL